MHTSIVITLLLPTLSLSLSIPPRPLPGHTPGNLSTHNHNIPRSLDPVADLVAIMPSSASCAGAKYADECATASAAVAPLIASFAQYGVTNGAEQAALLSWIAFESGDLKYNANHFPDPGRPGQGTRTMMMPNFVSKYAASIPELASQVAGKDPAGVLKLVQPDKYSFGSAAWFYSTQCSADVKKGVQTGSKAGWSAFLTQCVQTTVDGREASWQAACKALSVPAS